MDPKQLFPAHFESVFGKNKVLFPRELKKNIPKGLKKSIIPKGIKQVLFPKWAIIWLNILQNGKIKAGLPKYHLSTA